MAVKKVCGVILLLFAVSSLFGAILYFSPFFTSDSRQFQARLDDGRNITLISQNGEALAKGTLVEFSKAEARYSDRKPMLSLSVVMLVLAAIFSRVVSMLLAKWRLWYGIACLLSSIGVFSLRSQTLLMKSREALPGDDAFLVFMRGLWLKETSFILLVPAMSLLTLGVVLVVAHFFSSRHKISVAPGSFPLHESEMNRLLEVMDKKESEELLKLLSIQNQAEYTAEAYQAMELVLRRRGQMAEAPGKKDPDGLRK
jgi:hypothetical protein